MAPLIVKTNLTLAVPAPINPGSKATREQIIAAKNHVVACASHILQVKAKMAMTQQALAALPAADVEAAVVKGYPPPA